MCIAIISTAHPEYALILINNRDEFLDRPTKIADWWDAPNSNVLAGRDLLRAEQGTWLGITKEGRVAVLTNFREEGEIKPEARSRGGLVTAFLTQPRDSDESTEDFVTSLVEGDGLKGIGGFSLICGKIGEPLAVISNRTPDVHGISWIVKQRDETIGLSNAVISDRSWVKVTEGEKLVGEMINEHETAKGSKDELLHSLFQILSHDTLPRFGTSKDWQSQVKELRKSIFIPAMGGETTKQASAEDLAAAKTNTQLSVEKSEVKADSNALKGAYGTQKQTVILVANDHRVTFVERTLSTQGHMKDSLHDIKSFEFVLNRRKVSVR
ncbi:uncharacterized protein KY384_005512 [Bacidia gigantensis]|uniref:uncharacterized protein n=1 Tax=Bacidia gigantensis TaxID=2732470 RepID=UPI001D04A1D3|nr:uncharacterized protein KY384_005512 [Bacidia gigantensis]KAG8530030.1 hypothetical protein KY384_005512 [Bacidia gigantensis]